MAIGIMVSKIYLKRKYCCCPRDDHTRITAKNALHNNSKPDLPMCRDGTKASSSHRTDMPTE